MKERKSIYWAKQINALERSDMSVTEYIDEVPFVYRVVSDYKEVYIEWHLKDLPHLFTGRASSHEEKIEQYKSVLKELKKLNRKK